MNVTLQLVAVDIAETEKVEPEAAGSFMRRIQASTSAKNAYGRSDL